MTASINTRWFKDRLTDAQISQRRLAKSLDMDPSAISLLFAGKRRMQLDEATRIASILGVPLESVLDAAGIDPPTIGRAHLLLAGSVSEDGRITMKPPAGPRRVDRPTGSPDGTAALRLQGGPLNGWVVYYVITDRIDPAAVGHLCVVQVTDGARMLTVLTRGFTEGRWTLTGMFGGRVQEDVRIAWASPVTWLKG